MQRLPRHPRAFGHARIFRRSFLMPGPHNPNEKLGFSTFAMWGLAIIVIGVCWKLEQSALGPAPPKLPPDVERVLPGTIDVMREWLRLYKTVDGKPENKFGMEERAMGREYTMAVVQETHEFWRKLTSSGQKTV